MQSVPRLGPLPQVTDIQYDLTPPELPPGRVQRDAPEDKSEGELKVPEKKINTCTR